MEELFDNELQGMVKFTDATQQETPVAGKPATAKKNDPQQQKPAQRSDAKPMDAKWQPVKNETGYMEQLKACAKWCALYGGLSVLLFYWQQTGQMQSSAAVPSMLACALLAGISVGKHWNWKR